MTIEKTLVNFNVPTAMLKTFDRLCRLHGKSRSLVLNDLLYNYVLKVGLQAFSRIDQVRRIDENLRNALLQDVGDDLGDGSPKARNDVQVPLKSEISAIGGKDVFSTEGC